jgi:hypothetical protein
MSYLVVEENRRPIGFSCAECLHNGMGSVECYGCPLGLAGLGDIGELSLDNEQRDARAKAIEVVTPLLIENGTALTFDRIAT